MYDPDELTELVDALAAALAAAERGRVPLAELADFLAAEGVDAETIAWYLEWLALPPAMVPVATLYWGSDIGSPPRMLVGPADTPPHLRT